MALAPRLFPLQSPRRCPLDELVGTATISEPAAEGVDPRAEAQVVAGGLVQESGVGGTDGLGENKTLCDSECTERRRIGGGHRSCR